MEEWDVVDHFVDATNADAQVMNEHECGELISAQPWVPTKAVLLAWQ